MVTVQDQINLLRLSATEVVALSGWPEELVEDYLQLFDSISTLAENADSGNTDTEAIQQAISANTSQIRKSISQAVAAISLAEQNSQMVGIKSSLNRIQAKVSGIENNISDINQKMTILKSKLSASISTIRSDIDDLNQLIAR